MHKAKAENHRQQHQTGCTGGSDQSDRCATTASGCFEVEDMHQDRKICIEAKQVAVVGHPYEGATMKIPKVPVGGVYVNLI
jgi:D-hexose-6-phosphate mutarotase